MKKYNMEKLILTEKHSKSKLYLKLGYSILGLLIVTLSIVQLFLSNNVASYGAKVLALSTEEKKYEQENELLLKDVSKYTSIAAVSKRATELSFVPASKFLVVTPQQAVAFAR